MSQLKKRNLYLRAPGGQGWTMSVDSSGLLSTTLVTLSRPFDVIVLSGSSDGENWIIGVNDSGMLTTTMTASAPTVDTLLLAALLTTSTYSLFRIVIIGDGFIGTSFFQTVAPQPAVPQIPGSLSKYLSLVTSEHNKRPKYMAMLAALLQPMADMMQWLGIFPGLFDVDLAVGNQLDIIGLWVGRSRFIAEPIPNVFFSFDISGLGFDQGSWFGPGDSTAGLVALPDEAYRTLLKGVIAANHWDGTIPGAYAAWELVFDPIIWDVQIQDNQDMTIEVTLIGPTPDALTLALFTGGYLGLVPAGVSISFAEHT